MLGISYGELFLLLGATAAFIGPKDLPIIARTAGRLAGRAIGYVQMARGQFDSIMQQSQASQVHKELQDTMAQLEAIRYEIRSISIMNPGPLTRRLIDGTEPANSSNGTNITQKPEEPKNEVPGSNNGATSTGLTSLHSQATAYERLADCPTLEDVEKINQEGGSFTVLPVSAKSTGMLVSRKKGAKGSDIVLEAIAEAEVARSAKDFFAQPENQLPPSE